MGDVDDGVAVGLEPADEVEQALDVGPGEAAGGLVEDEHAAPDGDGPADFDELLLGDRQTPHRRVRRDVRPAERRQRVARRPADLRPVHEGPERRLHAEQDVLHHGQVRDER